MCTCSKTNTAPTSTSAALPPSVLDQLRQWRLQASLRFVSKSLRSSTPAKRIGK